MKNVWRYGRFDEEWKKFVGGDENKLTESDMYELCLFFILLFLCC